MVHIVSIHHYPEKFWMVAIISFFHSFYIYIIIYIYTHHLPQRGKFGEAFRWTTMIFPGHSEVWVIGVCGRWATYLWSFGVGSTDPLMSYNSEIPHKMPTTPPKDTCFWWAPDIRWCIFLSMHCVLANFEFSDLLFEGILVKTIQTIWEQLNNFRSNCLFIRTITLISSIIS